MNNPLMNKFLIFVLLLIGIVFLFRISFVLLGLVMPFILGFLIATLANPIKKKLQDLGLHHSFASFVSLFLLFVLVGALIYLILSIAKSGIVTVGDYSSQMAKSLSGSLRNTYIIFKTRFPSLLPQDYETFMESLKGGGILTLRGFDFGDRIFAVAKGLPSMLIFVIFTLMSSFYFSLEYDSIVDSLKKRIMSISWVEKVIRNFKSSARLGILSWFKAQLYIMSVTSITSIVYFLLLRVPYAIPLGIALAVFDALPIFGAGAILWPITVYYFIIQSYSKAALSLLVYIVIVSTRQIIEPRLIGKQIGIHPLVTLLTIYVSFKLLGVPGIILGVIGLAIATSILNSRAHAPNKEESA